MKKEQQLLNDLKNALEIVKIHDKDKFMLENIISSLEDELNNDRTWHFSTIFSDINNSCNYKGI